MVTGNAAEAGKNTRGWFTGQFLPEGSPLKNSDVEVKWGFEPAGTTKAGAGVNKVAKTLTVLVSGTFELHINDQKVVLQNPGDFVYFEPGEPHTWHAVTDSTVMSVRWPSIQNDQQTTV